MADKAAELEEARAYGQLMAKLQLHEHQWQTVTDSRGGEADYCAECQILDIEEEAR